MAPDALEPLDRWVLDRTQRLLGRCLEAFDRFEFHAVYHALNNYCSVDLSSLYLDIVKGPALLRGARFRWPEIGADRAPRYPANPGPSDGADHVVHRRGDLGTCAADRVPYGQHLLSPMPEPDSRLSDPALAAEWELRLDLRAEVLKALEVARQSGAIGHSLDARVVLYPDVYDKAPAIQELLRRGPVMPWEDVFIVSQAAVVSGEPSAELVYPEPTAGGRRQREGR